MASVIFTTSLVFLHILVSFSKSMPPVSRVHPLTLPESCIKKGFCFEKSALYPQDLIDDMSRIITFQSDQSLPGTASTHNNLAKRNSFFEEGDCDIEKIMDPIYAIVDVDNNVRVVLQSDSLPQIIEVEECIKPGRIQEPTVHFDQDTIDRFNLRCQEQTIDWPFLALNMDWTGIEMVKSKHGIPIACSCLLDPP